VPDKRLCGPAAMLIEEVLELLGELTAEVDLCSKLALSDLMR